MTKTTLHNPIQNSSRGLTGEDAHLDALLRAARPAVDQAREAALLERIMAAAEKTPRLAVVVSEAAPSSVMTAKAVLARPALPHHRARRDLWGAGGLLAASLVVGVMLGQSSLSHQTATRIEQATGLTLASASQEVARLLASVEFDEDEMP
jgi:hypothetical protein